jgi:hypothetical protein
MVDRRMEEIENFGPAQQSKLVQSKLLYRFAMQPKRSTQTFAIHGVTSEDYESISNRTSFLL